MRLFSGDGVCRKEKDYLTDLQDSEKSLNRFLSRPATTTPSSLDKEDLLLQVRGIPFVILAILGYLLLLSHLLNLFFYTLQEVKKHIRVSLLFTYKVLMNGWVNATPISFLYTNYNSVPSATRRIRLPVTISRSSPPNVTLSATKTVSPSSIRNKK